MERLGPVRARVTLLGDRADRGFPIESEHGQWLRDVVTTLLDAIDEFAKGAPHVARPLVERVESLADTPLPRLR